MNWSDPTRPPEVIEVGIVAYDATGGVVLREFTNLVTPTLNSRLSDYCKALLGIAQEQVDAACLLGGVVWGIEGWLHSLGVEGAPTCSWGVNDRCFLAKNCRLVDCQDPFEGRDHIDLKTIIGRVFDSSAVDSQDRDRMRQELGIPENPRRHRALDDARDLIEFLRWLHDRAGKAARASHSWAVK